MFMLVARPRSRAESPSKAGLLLYGSRHHFVASRNCSASRAGATPALTAGWDDKSEPARDRSSSVDRAADSPQTQTVRLQLPRALRGPPEPRVTTTTGLIVASVRRRKSEQFLTSTLLGLRLAPRLGSRITQRALVMKIVLTAQTYRREKAIEVSAGLIAGERLARPVWRLCVPAPRR